MTEVINSQTVTNFTHQEYKRYSRHLILPEVGLKGQKQLKASKVLIIGAGGLGSPLSMYLAAAGIGTLGLVDFDEVDYSNLQRQIIHSTDDVGRLKLYSARDTLHSINPNVEIILHETAISSDNALEIFVEYDIIVDCTDNFPTRYLTNDASVFLGKPYVYGSIFRFDGQITVFNYNDGPCYRCLYPSPPPPDLVPSCAVGGVLGVLPGIVGTIQATEVIKLLIGSGKPLSGRLLLLDALDMEFRELKIQKDPNCVVCGETPSLTSLIDYNDFCGVEGSIPLYDENFSLKVQDLQNLILKNQQFVLLDVREAPELEISRINSSIHIPKDFVLDRLNDLPKDQPIVVHCKTGVRSGKIVQKLRDKGYDARNLIGGINAWAREIDMSLPQY